MRNDNTFLYILGKIIKWAFLVMAANLVSIIFYAIKQSLVDGGIVFMAANAAICGLIALAGYRMERGGKGGKEPAIPKPAATSEAPKPAAEAESRPAPPSPGVVANGEYMYRFRMGVDLFAEGVDGLDYPELSGYFRIAANLGRHILGSGGAIRWISIGGGSNEVMHTGAVAYGNTYDSLESFVQNCVKDIDDAADEAEEEYGGWFTGLDYHFIDIGAELKGKDIEVRFDIGWALRVSFPLRNESEGFAYLTDLARRFGSRDFRQWVSAEEPFGKAT